MRRSTACALAGVFASVALVSATAQERYEYRRKSWWFGRCKAEDREIDYLGWEEGAPLRSVMRALLGLCGAKAPVTLHPEVPMCQIGRLKQGDWDLVGGLPSLPRISWAYTFKEAEIPPPSPAQIHFGKTAHIYDVRAGRYLGRAGSCDVMLQPGRAKLFGLMPYRVTALKLDVAATVQQGEAASFRASVQADGERSLHVLRMTVLDPAGRAVRHYARNVKAVKGVFDGKWTPALNDAPGVWQIVVRDVISGQTTRASIEVTKR